MPTLLVVDDEDSVRYSFRYVFEEDGVRVLTAATAAEGLELVQREAPEVVVLDLQLPDRPGLGVNLLPKEAKKYLDEGDADFFD